MRRIRGLRGLAVALAAGAIVLAADTARAGPGDSCGGVANLQCDVGLFCDVEPGVCRANGAGVCVTVPMACSRLSQPVCGCDGRTFPNDCERQRAGVARQADGPCR